MPSSGTRPFQYNSLLFDAAARIIPRLTNKSVADFVQEEFFNPLQLKASYEFPKIKEKAVGRWSRVGKSEVGDMKEDLASGKLPEGEIGRVNKGLEVEYGIEQCGEAWGAGRVWMNSDDLVSLELNT